MTEATTQTKTKSGIAHELAKHLKQLHKNKNRQALAQLRSGLGKEPGEAMEMFAPLRRFLAKTPKPHQDRAVFVVAALFADYSEAKTNVGNLGASFRRYFVETKSDSAEKRFIALLNADAEDLPVYLRQAIGMLRSKEIAVNWEQLFKDVRNWTVENDLNTKYPSVQSRWAHSFWGSYDNDNENTQDSQNNLKGEN